MQSANTMLIILTRTLRHPSEKFAAGYFNCKFSVPDGGDKGKGL